MASTSEDLSFRILSLLVGTLVTTAVVIQVTLLSRLGLPGATPDIVVVTVVAIALATGPVQGAVAGFESRVYRRDGAVIWISETCREVRGSDGTLLY